MQFPYTPKALGHYTGGAIVTVHGIAHRKQRPSGGRSRDYYFFDCDVKWPDTGKTSRAEVEPFKLAESTEGQPEVKALAVALDEYLDANGRWSREGKVQGWIANR